MQRQPVPVKFDHVAIVLHWTIAFLLILAIIVSEMMPEVGLRGALYSLHATLGITILMLSVVRLIWRLTHAVPGYPGWMRWWQKTTARAVSMLFYFLMIAIPLTGWLAHSIDAVSRPFFINTDIFGLMPTPILPVNGIGQSTLLSSSFLNWMHEQISDLMISLIVLHIGAALKHHFIDRDDILNRMLPRMLRM